MSRYLFAALLGLLAIFTLYGTGTLLRINQGSTTVSRGDDVPAPPTAVPDVAAADPADLSSLERAGRFVIRQTSAEALEQIAQGDTTPPEPEPEPTPEPQPQPQTVEPAPEPSPQPIQDAIPALW